MSMLKFETRYFVNNKVSSSISLDTKLDCLIIWLHGLGASASDFTNTIPMLGLNNTSNIQFVYPQAPSIPVTINNNFVMPAWYDIYQIGVLNKVDELGINNTCTKLDQLIQKLNTQSRQYSANLKIIVAGFSQGGSIALNYALSNKTITACIGLSTWLPNPNLTTTHKPNILLCHGMLDPVVLYAFHQMTNHWLDQNNITYTANIYNIAHEVSTDVFLDCGKFINTILTS